MKLLITGFGTMGSALYDALTRSYKEKPNAIQPIISVCDTHTPDTPPERFYPSFSAALATERPDAVLICVKPQSFKALVSELSPKVGKVLSHALVISIMAGVSIKTIESITSATRVIRTMPNLAATVRSSTTGMVAGAGCSLHDIETTRSIFATAGTVLELPSEDAINEITSLSGSGIAYFFYLTELIMEQAEAYGFTREESRSIAVSTLAGAAALMQGSEQSPRELKEAVTSKGGTTQAALTHMMDHNINTIVKNAILAAKKRAEELA